jgi:hypothetical protein
MAQYLLVTGHRVDHRPSTEVAAYLARLGAMVDDPSVRDLIGVAFSEENPLLARGAFPGRGWVTPEVFANPSYRVLRDLVWRKELAARGIDRDTLAAEYVLSIDEVAHELGVSSAEAREATRSHRLDSFVKAAGVFVSRRGLESFRRLEAWRREVRGHDLVMRFGNSMHTSFRVRAPSPLAEHRRICAHVYEARVPGGWRKVAVMTSGRTSSGQKIKPRTWLLEEGDELAELRFRDFYVRGRFKKTVINNPRRARETYVSFQPE